MIGVILLAASVAHAQTPAQKAQSAMDTSGISFELPKLTLPTWEELQKEKERRDLAKAPEPPDAPSALGASFLKANLPPQNQLLRPRRVTTETLDVQLSRPAKRIELGAGWTERGFDPGYGRSTSSNDVHAFLRVDLSALPSPRKLFHSPTFVHEVTEISSEKVEASRDDYDVHSRP